MTLRFSPARCARRAAVFATVLVLAACGAGEQTERPNEANADAIPVRVQTVQPGLQRTFAVTGEVRASSYAQLTALFRSDVDAIHVKLGQEVRRGQPLVTLTADNVRARLNSARASYGTALQNLQQTQITAQKNVDTAAVQLKAARENLASLLQQNQARRQQAEAQLESAKVSQDLGVGSAQTAVDNALRDLPNVLDSALTAVDTYLEISEEQQDNNSVQERHIGVKDEMLLSQTEFLFYDVQEVVRWYDTRSVESALEAARQTERLLRSMLDILRNSVTSPEYTQAELNADISSVQSQLSTVRSHISNLQTAQSNLESARQQVGDRSQRVREAEAVYQSTLSELERLEQDARLQVEQREIALESAQANAEASQIGARSTLASVSGELSQARIEANELQLGAPFAGTVVDVAVREGQEVQAGTALVSVENADTLEVIAYLSGKEREQVASGSTVTINDSIPGTVTAVAGSADPVAKKYKVEVRTDAGALQPGAFVRVQFRTQADTADRRIFVPVTAVHVATDGPYVWVLAGTGSSATAQKQDIAIGAVEGEYILVQQGVQPGDELITDGSRLIERSGTPVTVRNR